jgi:signal transduction histidine kinase/CheY-like chemotaxis protein
MSKLLEDCFEVLVLAPLGRDAQLIGRLLGEHGYTCRSVTRLSEIQSAIPLSLGVAVVGEEALSPRALDEVATTLAGQPSWSDVPFVLLSASRHSPQSLLKLGNVTMLDRPVQVRTLVSAVEAALRARRRQYAARREIAQRDQFLAMLGHELRNPLSAILFAAEFMRRQADAGGAPDKHVSIVHRQATHLARLVDDLLDVSRVTAGKVVLARKVLDLSLAAQTILQTNQDRLLKRDLRATFTAPAEPVLVDADPVRLEQVLSNVLTNAIKYTPAGGSIDLIVERTGDQGRARIRDTGIGMASDMVPRVFELFAQAQTAIARTQGGMGIGLTLVRHLVELHGGKVEAHSEGVGKGSEFTITLPIATRVAMTASSMPPPTPRPALRLVVVEDNPDLSELLREMLEHAGHQVQVASDGAAGLALISAVQPDCALVDIGLPVLNGYEVAEQVRKRGQRQPKLVALTGYGQPEDRQRALDAGFDAHLKKPVELDALERLLSKVQPQAEPA